MTDDLAWDSLSPEEQRWMVREFALIQRIAKRYGITEEEATQIRLGILRGELPNPWEV